MSERNYIPEIIHPQLNLINQRESTVWINGTDFDETVVYIPGLAGDTMEGFGLAIQPWLQKIKGRQAIGILHSGIIKNENNHRLTAQVSDMTSVVNGHLETLSGQGLILNQGVIAKDWVQDIKDIIEKIFNKSGSIKIVAHSLGGVFAVIALSEMIDEGSLPKNNRYYEPLTLITVSAPHYLSSSLPDTTPLAGTYDKDGFTYYHHKDGNRIPMASVDAWKQIWAYLHGSETIKVANEDVFTNSLLACFKTMEEKAPILAQTDIRMVSLNPHADRWVSQKSGQDLQQLVGRKVIVDTFSPPMAWNNSMVGKNTHNRVNQWLPIVQKYL